MCLRPASHIREGPGRARDERRDLDAPYGSLHDWALLRLLQPAAGAVYHARHGLMGLGDLSGSVQPQVLYGDRSAAAASIAAALADELHVSLADDSHLAETTVTPNMQDRDAKLLKPRPFTRTCVLPMSGPCDGEMLVTTSASE